MARVFFAVRGGAGADGAAASRGRVVVTEVEPEPLRDGRRVAGIVSRVLGELAVVGVSGVAMGESGLGTDDAVEAVAAAGAGADDCRAFRVFGIACVGESV